MEHKSVLLPVLPSGAPEHHTIKNAEVVHQSQRWTLIVCSISGRDAELSKYITEAGDY